MHTFSLLGDKAILSKPLKEQFVFCSLSCVLKRTLDIFPFLFQLKHEEQTLNNFTQTFSSHIFLTDTFFPFQLYLFIKGLVFHISGEFFPISSLFNVH